MRKDREVSGKDVSLFFKFIKTIKVDHRMINIFLCPHRMASTLMVLTVCWMKITYVSGSLPQDCQCTGAPNDGFLPNALKRCFRLSGVLLKLCRLILGCAIKFLSVRYF